MVDQRKKLGIIAQISDAKDRAGKLAKRLNADWRMDPVEKGEYDLLLIYEKEGLTLSDGTHKIRGDFTHMLPRLKPGNLNGELIVKASGIRKMKQPCRAVDATAGMGEDSLLLAAAGFEVQMFEYDPVIAALLEDTIRRSLSIPELAKVVQRMHLTEGNSLEALKDLPYHPEVILLDPMFPQRRKSGLVKKKFQLIHHLERPCDDEEGLVQAALAAKPGRIIIKRPAKGAYLAGIKPSFSLQGKAIRCDCLINLP